MNKKYVRYYTVDGISSEAFFQGEGKRHIPSFTNVIQSELLHEENEKYIVKVNPINGEIGLTYQEIKKMCPSFQGNELDRYFCLTKKCMPEYSVKFQETLLAKQMEKKRLVKANNIAHAAHKKEISKKSQWKNR